MSIFSKIERTKIPGNTFDLSHDRKFSGKMGKLIPFLVHDTIPGDKTHIRSSAFVRFAPLIAPIMHQVSVYLHYFFVPNRLLWDEWEKFITAGEDGTADPVWPYLRFDYNDEHPTPGSLGDYLGLPTEDEVAETIREVSVLPFAAYQKIWYEYYRDQNLQPETEYPEINVVSGNNNFQWPFGELRTRAWQHDYFTSALPWTQKGPAVTIPLGGEAPIFLREDFPLQSQQLRNPNTGALVANAAGDRMMNQGPTQQYIGLENDAVLMDLNDSHYADLSQATASTINDLRRAFKLQEWLEKNARGGSRYIESIAVHFGVTSSDARLQRPEYLGGFQAPVKISEVLQNAPPTGEESTPQGNMAGHAVGLGGGKKISHFSEEHGYIIGIMSVMPKTAYQQGIPKHFLRRDKFQYYWPEFAHIGEQPIEDMEIYQTQGTDGLGTFGYTPRYAEYKYMNSSVHGDFKTTLDFWHMGRKFSTKPLLNEDFILCDYTEFDRIFAVQDDSDHLWCHVLNDVKANRKMPFFGTPKF